MCLGGACMTLGRVTLLAAVGAVAALSVNPASAAESATSFYLLGSKGSMAGFVPPPGTYFVDQKYLYNGKAQAAIPDAGLIVAGVEATAFYELPTVLWVTPHMLFGGHLGFGFTVPVGYKNVTADASLNLPPPIGITLQRNLKDDWFNFGDPVASAVIGWHQGNLHWSLGGQLNIPIGAWERGRLANIGFNHWALDLTGAVTHLDPKTGIEISFAAGLTFNWENPDTDYKTGTEFHLEAALMQHVSKQFAFGINAYHYQQIEGDSGTGARLGEFKGRVTGIGPAVNYSFNVGMIPVATTLKWQHEFNVENRLTGNAGLLSFTMPLAVATPPPQ